ncbi:lipoyl(octanoyl) transferase LipB [Geobacter sp. AOG1]|uniref:lipoyl(octanoyl) transferase LipB n=1 Tax=Geobacter sp. AOG1 TaxID=1566346 RepID=UPI001CC3941A|nr:lipoyl(octanoyl) transferase LipB [Geobacter sp. AOG1]GFE57610.1 octanoyltransferase [Geobacter sp. AOG1]
MEVTDLGMIGFDTAYALQERLVAGIAAGTEPETLLLLEHPAVYTIGSGGDGANVLDSSVEVRRINRGGDVTWHGPGQLVGYPLISLDRRGRDLHRYLRFLEELLIRVAAEFSVAARRVPGRTGVWTGAGKLASIGVGVRRWVTMHGFAVNVVPDLAAFDLINPCGIAGCPVTSLARECGAAVSMADVRKTAVKLFAPLLADWMPEKPTERDPIADVVCPLR